MTSCGKKKITSSLETISKKQDNLIHSYKLDKRVSDFPLTEDLSTPEAAYATLMRDYMATGASDAEWSKITTIKMSSTSQETVSSEMKENYLNARIVEVRIFKKRIAQVIAKMTEDSTIGYDQRFLVLHNGRWLNVGQEVLAPTLEAARKTFARKCERIYQSQLKKLGEEVANCWNRPPIPDPDEHLKPYVDFLRRKGCQPHGFMINAFKRYKLVTMGEIHNRPRYWAFNAELVRDPAFAESVGTVYLELPINHQQNINRFLTQDTCEKDIVIDMLRDFTQLGWPCQPTLDFFIAVWDINQNLSAEKKLRIKLVDMERPWEKIFEREDWQKYDVDRDLFMAQNILKDQQTEQGKERHGFFITGMGHAMEGFYYADQATKIESAGSYLEQALGDQLFTVFQHAPVMTNRGRVSGRLSLGLIDTAFKQLDDRPIAFTLSNSPFGSLPFDGMPDFNGYGNFYDGYDAYLFLSPLENEFFSPLIEGFYSEEFTSEIARRYQLMNGKPIPEKIAGAEKMTAMRASFWGQPRQWIRRLGPKEAWHSGDQWQIKIQKAYHADVQYKDLVAELDKIYSGIRKIGAQKHSWQTWGREFGFSYMTRTDWPGMYSWWYEVTKTFPLESVQYGKLTRNRGGLPQIKATVLLQNGISFAKVFLFEYDALQGCWTAKYGLDLHLDEKWKDLPSRD